MKEPTSAPSYDRHQYPPEIIAYAVWLYFRFALSYRDVEELLAKHGVLVTCETARQWCRKFGQRYASTRRRQCPQPGDKWHLDEVFIRINGATRYLWRAVDQDGHVLDVLVQSRRNKASAKKFYRKLLKRLRYIPRFVITNNLASYGVANCEVLPRVEHRQHKRLDNRAEKVSPAYARARAPHAPLQESWARLAFPRRLRPDRRPLPPAPPSPHRRHLSTTPG